MERTRYCYCLVRVFLDLADLKKKTAIVFASGRRICTARILGQQMGLASSLVWGYRLHALWHDQKYSQRQAVSLLNLMTISKEDYTSILLPNTATRSPWSRGKSDFGALRLEGHLPLLLSSADPSQFFCRQFHAPCVLRTQCIT